MRPAVTSGAIAELTVHGSIVWLAVTALTLQDHLVGAPMAEHAPQRTMLGRAHFDLGISFSMTTAT